MKDRVFCEAVGVTGFCILPWLCESSAVRAVALLGPIANEHHVRQFEATDVDIFSGNELDPNDHPDAVLIFGGDGTIHRYLGVLARKAIPVLAVPLGSANDFATSIGIHGIDNALAAWQQFCSRGDNTRFIDLGMIRRLDGEDLEASSPNDNVPSGTSESAVPWESETLETLHFVPSGPRHDLPKLGARIMQSQLRRAPEARGEPSPLTYFGCIAGTGLDAAVNRLTLKQPRWLRSHGGYVVALLQVLGNFRPPTVRVSVERDGRLHTEVDEAGFLVAAGNGPQYGQGMRLTHEARMDDGLLDVCFVRRLSKMRLLRLFRLVYRGGHISLEEVRYFRASRLRLETDPILEVFADGEFVCQTPVEITVQPRALKIITNL